MLKAAFLPILLSLILIGCGEDGAKGLGGGNGDDSDNGADANAGLFGSWAGSYSDKATEGDLNLQDADAKIDFVKGKEGSDHSFLIDLPSAGVMVKGTFVQADNESLLLEIEESTLSSIGLPSSTPRVSFRLLGKAMEIYNSRFSMLVKRNGDAKKPADDQDQDQPNTSFVDNWNCEDTYLNDWVLLITDKTFSGDVNASDGRILRMSGLVIADASNLSKAELQVKASSTDSFVGSKLAIEVKKEKLQVQLISKANNDYETFSCNRD